MEINGFHVLNLADGIFHIGDATGAFSTLVLGKERAFLADTTSGFFDLAGAVRSFTNLPLVVANTHGHIHHIGGNYQFDCVYLSPNERTGAEHSCLEESRYRMMAAYPSISMEPDRRNAYLSYSLENVVDLEPDMVFDLGGETVVTIPMSNHTVGSVGFLCKERRILIAGDALSPWMCLYGPRASSLEEHCKLLKGLDQDDRFDYFLNSHSTQLWSRGDVNVFLNCAEHARGGHSSYYVDPLFPDLTGWQYIQGSAQSSERAAIIFNPDHIEEEIR